MDGSEADPADGELVRVLAEAERLGERALEHDDHAALDALGRLLAPLVAAGAVPADDLVSYGLVFLTCGETAADFETTTRWLREALSRGVDDPADTWHMLGMAYGVWGMHGGPDTVRDEAARCFREALARGADPSALGFTPVWLVVRQVLQRWDADLLDSATFVVDPKTVAADAETLADARLALDSAYQVVQEPGLDPVDRARMARDMIALESTLALLAPRGFNRERFDRLVSYARAHPNPPRGWAESLAATQAMVDNFAAVIKSGFAPRDDSGETAAREVMRGEPSGDDTDLAGLAAAAAALGSGDLAQLGAARSLLEQSDDPAVRIAATLMGLIQGDPSNEDALAIMDQVVAQAEGTAPETDNWLAGGLAAWARQVGSVLRSAGDGSLEALAQLPPPPFADAPAICGLFAPPDALETVKAILPMLAGETADHGAARARLVDAEREVSGLDGIQLGVAEGLTARALAEGWLLLARAGGDRQDAAHAVGWWDKVLAWAGGEDHPDWARFALSAAESRRLRAEPADRADARALGLRALRGYAWRVLLQSGSYHALTAAQAAAADAQWVARWCAQDHRADDPRAVTDLVTALEAGRGLALHAAVTHRSAVEQLGALGHDTLARAWAAAGPEPEATRGDPAAVGVLTDLTAGLADDIDRSRLRRRVLDVLGGPSASGDLLDPPSLPEIRRALRRHRSRALVYLAPGDTPGGGSPGPGTIVIVPAEESAPVQCLEWPDLLVGVGSRVDHYARAYAAWRRAAREPETADGQAALRTWRAALSAVTDWAGDVAAEMLHTAVGPGVRSADPPRITITAIGALALVPWHAARLPPEPGADAGARLVERVAVSYIPSARLLCRTAEPAADDGGVDGESLFVGSPPGTRPTAAGTEAWALREALYPRATFLGRRPATATGADNPAGRGTPAELLGWLRRARQPDVLHLACHGFARPDDPGSSYLELADRIPITVRDLLADLPAETRPPRRVFLAACSTNVTGTDYDEAFSIATAFLAAGARTVYGSLWDLPAPHTSKIMFVLHDELVTERCSPADALQAAQDWALDPDRVPPASMPAAIVALSPAEAAGLPLDDLAAWAGLVHLGA